MTAASATRGTVNCVMLVRDRPKLTRQAISTMFENKGETRLNLTVVDDGSEDQTRELLETEGYEMTIVRLYPSRGIVGLARNLGILASERLWGRGDYLYLADNDAAYLTGWLDILLASYKEVEPMGVRLLGAYNHPFHQPNTHYYATTIGGTDYRVGTHNAVQGISHLMRWKTFDDYGPFDAHATGIGQSEDFAFCRRIVESGYLVGSVYPRCILNCGLLDSYGKPCVGYEAVKAELEGEISARGLESKVYYPTSDGGTT